MLSPIHGVPPHWVQERVRLIRPWPICTLQFDHDDHGSHSPSIVTTRKYTYIMYTCRTTVHKIEFERVCRLVLHFRLRQRVSKRCISRFKTIPRQRSYKFVEPDKCLLETHMYLMLLHKRNNNFLCNLPSLSPSLPGQYVSRRVVGRSVNNLPSLSLSLPGQYVSRHVLGRSVDNLPSLSSSLPGQYVSRRVVGRSLDNLPSLSPSLPGQYVFPPCRGQVCG